MNFSISLFWLVQLHYTHEQNSAAKLEFRINSQLLTMIHAFLP